jgi:phage terminase large subunit-like protein
MGLRGPGAQARKKLDETPRRKPREPWKKPGLNRAERVIAFCEAQYVTQGKFAGKKFKFRPWQVRWIKRVYREDRKHQRIVRTAVDSMARKNGKTQIAALLSACHLMGPEAEMRGEVYSAATDKTQAGKLYDELKAIIKMNAGLRERVNIVDFHKKIEVLEGDGIGSIYLALSGEVENKHGLSPSFVVYDELGQAKSRDLFDALDTAMGARENPLMVVISTQAADDNTPMSELIDYGLRVQAGEVKDPSFDLELWTAPAEADPWAEETWRLANPALGDFRSIEDVRRMAVQAQEQRSKEPAFRNLILNQRIAAHERAISRIEWKRCEAVFALEDFEGMECIGALDLSARRDLTCLLLIFQRDGLYWAWPIFFMPADLVRENAERDNMPYDRWAKEGHIVLIPGASNDPLFIAGFIGALAARFKIKTIAYDRWRIEDLRRELNREGIEVSLTEHGQGFRDMGPAVDAMEEMIGNRKLRHPKNPVLTMCAANCVYTRDPAGNRKLDKAKSTGRIDGVVSLAMASKHTLNPPEVEGPSVYATRGALVM